MIQLKLKLNSDKPSTVYSLNGKSYRLIPGTNVLNLEYEDYVSLAKALAITPVDKPSKEHKEDKAVEDHKEDAQPEIKDAGPVHNDSAAEQPSDDNVNDDSVNNDIAENDISENELDTVADVVDNNTSSEAANTVNEAVDYSSWSYTKLKSEYKRITGNACKLKKEEVIAFLQENANNVE